MDGTGVDYMNCQRKLEDEEGHDLQLSLFAAYGKRHMGSL